MRVLFLWLMLAVPMFGATVYVGPASTGDASGSDFSNLKISTSALPGTRGNTYVLVDGTYAGPTLNTAVSGTTTITVRHANATQDSGVTGYSSSLVVTNALFTALYISTGYYIFDGSTGWDNTGYGFEVFPAATDDGITIASTAGVIVRRCNIHTYPSTDTLTEKNLWGTPLGSPTASTNKMCIKATLGGTGLLLQSNWLHHVYGCPIQIRGWDGITIEHNRIEKNKSTAVNHAEGIADDFSSNHTNRYNKYLDIEGTAIIALIAQSPGGTSRVVRIYGNVFANGAAWNAATSKAITVIFDASNFSKAEDWQIVNNTFANLNLPAIDIAYYGGLHVGFTNNIVWGNRTDETYTKYYFNYTGYDYNYYSALAASFASGPWTGPTANEPAWTTGPNSQLWSIPTWTLFQNHSSFDYRLTAPLTNFTGVTLTSEFDRDMFGNIRGADGVWDRGAFEFTAPATGTINVHGQLRVGTIVVVTP